MPNIPSICQPIQESINFAKANLKDLQEQLKSASPGEKREIIQLINETKGEISSLTSELRNCIQTNEGLLPPTPKHPPYIKGTGNILRAGEGLGANDRLFSNVGNVEMIMQGDGNLVLYFKNGRDSWGTGTENTDSRYVIMQGDGNLVIYNGSGQARWASNTDGNPGAYFILQDDGNAVIYKPNGTPIWASNTMLFELFNNGNSMKFVEDIPWDGDMIGGGFGAKISITLNRDNTYYCEVIVTKGGIQNYDYNFNILIISDKVSIAYKKGGTISGAFLGKKTECLNENGNNSNIGVNFDTFLNNGRMEIAKKVDGDLTEILKDYLGALQFLLNLALLKAKGYNSSKIIIIGSELSEFIISSPGFTNGCIRQGEHTWLSGPANTLYFLGDLILGNKSRVISDEEYNWANQKVFGYSLPPKELILITNVSINDSRKFVFPRFDGKITVNLGLEEWRPIDFIPDIFIHELTHVCQCYYWGSESFANRAIIEQVKDLCCTDAYNYNPPIPSNAKFTDYGVEQQATIVQNWFLKKDTSVEANNFIQNYVKKGIY